MIGNVRDNLKANFERENKENKVLIQELRAEVDVLRQSLDQQRNEIPKKGKNLIPAGLSVSVCSRLFLLQCK